MCSEYKWHMPHNTSENTLNRQRHNHSWLAGWLAGTARRHVDAPLNCLILTADGLPGCTCRPGGDKYMSRDFSCQCSTALLSLASSSSSSSSSSSPAPPFALFAVGKSRALTISALTVDVDFRVYMPLSRMAESRETQAYARTNKSRHDSVVWQADACTVGKGVAKGRTGRESVTHARTRQNRFESGHLRLRAWQRWRCGSLAGSNP
jgi:hypothetical protein